MKLIGLIKLTVVVVLMSFFVACSSIQDFYSDNDRVFDAAVKIATFKAIDGDTERAGRIVDIAEEVKAIAAKDATTSSIVEQAIFDRVDWSNLSPEETILAQEFVKYLSNEIETRISVDALDADYSVLVAHIADTIIQAAELYQQTSTIDA